MQFKIINERKTQIIFVRPTNAGIVINTSGVLGPTSIHIFDENVPGLIETLKVIHEEKYGQTDGR